MSDDIRGMTAQLAAEPGSLVFLELGEALRRRGQLDAAYKVARAGVQRYPELARAHDLIARILSDRGEPERAFDAWAAALRFDPGLVGAHKGLGFLYHQTGDPASAEKHLAYAAQVDSTDAGVAAALARVRTGAPVAKSDAVARAAPPPPPAPAAPSEPTDDAHRPVRAEARGLPFSFDDGEEGSGNGREASGRDGNGRHSDVEDSVFAGLDGGADGLLLVDANGRRLGGGLRSPGGGEVADQVAAQLAGVSKEAERTARLLSLGEWQSVAVECPDGNLLLTAPTGTTLLLTVRGAEMPMGRVARFAERASAAAKAWLERSE